MVNFAELLAPARVRVLPTISSKKRALEQLANLLAENDENLETAIFDRLVQREHLGSTGLGSGIALPHGRLPEVTTALAAFLKLNRPIPFEAPDNQPVDLLFGLVVPDHFTNEHLKIIAHAAELFRQPEFCQALRATTDPQLLFQKLVRGH